MKRFIGIGVILLLILGFSTYAFLWIKHRIEYAVSNAVFVRAEELSYLAFKVDGRIEKVYKDLVDWVEEGEVLAELDPTYYKLALESLKRKIEALRKKKRGLELKLERIRKELGVNLESSKLRAEEVKKKQEALEKRLKAIEAKLELLRKDRERYRDLLEKGLIPRRKFEEVDTQYKAMLEEKRYIEKSIEELNTAYLRALTGIKSARISLERIKELKKEIEYIGKEIESLEEKKKLAEERLKDTKLRAPFKGIVAKRFISRGDTVRAGQPVFALVNPESFYIEVLLEETKLKGVKKGSIAYIRLDAYPNLVFEGVVEDISPASAATFALVPRDVSAGEFTKVVQRIPVKIKITKGDLRLLRVGMGGEVEIRRMK